MKTNIFPVLPLMLAFTWGWMPAQTNTPPAPPAPKPHVVDVPQPVQPTPEALAAAAAGTTETLDPARIAAYQKRFEQGYALEKDGKLAEARTIFEGIIAEQPNAKRSLLEAGRISFKLGDLALADEDLEKLHELAPDFPEAIELLIQVNQALKHDVKVALLLRDFRALHDSGKIPELTSSPCFVRERMQVDQDEIVVSQFFDYMQDPNTVWMTEVFDANGLLKRRLLLNYDVATTKALRAKDPKYANTQVFTWYEHVITNQRVTAVKAYLQIFALPDYAKFRSAMLIILANPPTSGVSVPVDVPLNSDHAPQ